MELKVKGSLLVDYIRMIRANSELAWDEYLSKEDFDILEGRILPSSWYSFETFQRTGLAVYQLLAKGDLQAVWAWGRISIEQLAKIYKQIVVPGDPLSGVKKFMILRGQFFNFEPIALEELGSKHVQIKVENESGFAGMEPFTYQLAGGMERLIEMCDGHDVVVEIVKQSWKGDSETLIEARWE